ncbi:glutamine amidotransferase [Planobispora rosea]|uniref:Glutamine amidotransferase n=1 Tax=Planobispora rosea TaxID=35762 RepID=A0A8J3S9G9_PLARO|nr:DJ-1/PfpI family protein [Planobispora rosea]GGT02436.1 glutamine amidotransferase [Planobispora rosea]GIH88542.1 glutamine amidotransferase [Planobispora rosea]
MHVAVPLYPRFTALDAVGPYTVLAFTPGWSVTFVAAVPGPVVDDNGKLSITATAAFEDVPRPDVILVPGGPGTVAAMGDEGLLSWIRAAHEHTRWTTSVCSGSFVLGAAGVLTGRRATSHWGWVDQLSAVGAQPVKERVVIDGRIVTAAGVSAGIDMALALLAEAADEETARTVQLAIEYDPQPPFGGADPHTAPGARREAALSLIS